jgi:RHS repeat-associated protein
MIANWIRTLIAKPQNFAAPDWFQLVLSASLLAVTVPTTANAQAPLMTTVAGAWGSGYSGDGGPAINAHMDSVQGVTVDSANNIYIVDSENYCIRKVTASTGIITTVVGNSTPGYSGDGGQATSAQISPSGIALDAMGNMYITDAGAEVIRKVTVSTGVITTIAGNGTFGYSGDGSAATSAELGDPQGIALDNSGNIYFADTNNDVVRRIDASNGTITTVAGNHFHGYSGDGGQAIAASLSYPIAVALDAANNNLYISDLYNQRIRKVNLSGGVIGTFVGSGVAGYSGDGGPATSAKVVFPEGMTFDSLGNFYFADNGNSVVRAVLASNGSIVTAAGNGQIGFTGDNQPATTIALYFPSSVVVDSNGNLEIADTTNDMVRKVAAPILNPAVAIYDNGIVTLTVNGISDSVTYNATLNTTAGSLAAALASAVNADANSPVTATANGASLAISSRQPGAASNYSYSLTSTYDTQDFTQASFSATSSDGSLTGGSDPGTVAAPVYSYNIPPTTGYAANGNLLAYTDSVMGSWTFGYDNLNRLSSGSVTPAFNQNQFYCWSYDSFGNRTNESGSDQNFVSIDGQPPCQPATSANLTSSVANYADNTNRVSGTNANGVVALPQYDAAGNMTMDGTNSYLYDGEGRICAVGYSSVVTDETFKMQYLYDTEGRRVAKGTITAWSCDISMNNFTPTDQYLLGPSGEQMTELDRTIGNPKHTNIYAAGSLMATYDNRGTHYHLSDWLGTRRAQTNSTGALEATYQSLPFGNGLPPLSPDDPTEQHFTGKERDSESGLDYFGARYYGSSMGRFSSPDDDSGQHADQPQSWNLYSYVLNNPLTNTDPDGHDCIDTTNLKTDGTVTVTRGTSCANNLGPNGTYINGTVNTDTLTTDGKGSVGYDFTSYDGQTGGGGIISPSDPYGPLEGPANLAGANMIGNGGMAAINEFGKNMLYEAGGQLVGRGIGLGVEALRAARAAKAAEALAIAERVTQHAYGKHAGEFGNITRNEFKDLVQETMANPSEVKSLSNGRTAYWNDKEQMVVIENGTAPDKSTAFRPTNGKSYFDNSLR